MDEEFLPLSTKFALDKALKVKSNGAIIAPVTGMNDGTYQSLTLLSKDENRQVTLALTASTGLQIFVDRDGGGTTPETKTCTVDFIPRYVGKSMMQLSGMNALIMSPINSTKKFKITVDDTGTLSATEVT